MDEADLEAELADMDFDDELDIGLGDAEPAIPAYLQTGEITALYSTTTMTFFLCHSRVPPPHMHASHPP